MSYVKISDPAIIDLAGIQQIINVVNQHSDYLNVLVNKLGINNVPSWDADDYDALNDMANTTIAFGKRKIADVSAQRFLTPGNKRFYARPVTFGSGVSFSQPPRIIATVDNSEHNSNTQLDYIVSVHDVTTGGFTIRLMRAGAQGTLELDEDILVNWVAIGPR
jgi:hypothetical protein